MEMTMLFLVFFLLMILQAFGTYLQVKAYKKAVRRLHKTGNVGIGSKKGRLRPGNIVVIACDQKGVITGGEIMEGFTIFNGFRQLTGIVGKTIYELREEYRRLPEKRQKLYKAHLQALDALHIRLESAEE